MSILGAMHQPWCNLAPFYSYVHYLHTVVEFLWKRIRLKWGKSFGKKRGYGALESDLNLPKTWQRRWRPQCERESQDKRLCQVHKTERMNGMPKDERREAYLQKLRDPRWQRRRLEIMERDHFACRWCRGDKETLNVHHLYYESGREPWDYPAEAFLTLCETCHEQESAYRKESQ